MPAILPAEIMQVYTILQAEILMKKKLKTEGNALFDTIQVGKGFSTSKMILSKFTKAK